MSDFDSQEESNYLLANRFRNFLPVVVDIETGGFNSQTDAMLEISAVILGMDDNGILGIEQTYFHRIIPFRRAKTRRGCAEVYWHRSLSPTARGAARERGYADNVRHGS